MTEKDYVVLVDLRVKPETRKQIEELAHRRGYDSTDEYVRALIASDANAHGEPVDLDDEGDPIEDFRQGWKDAMTGKTLPASALWDLGDDD
ncbi:MAG: hypothetical protein ABI970_05065 [Chloroflexota bacterium]|nr:hypothetical protein [Anaerolineae bacterium]